MDRPPLDDGFGDPGEPGLGQGRILLGVGAEDLEITAGERRSRHLEAEEGVGGPGAGMRPTLNWTNPQERLTLLNRSSEIGDSDDDVIEGARRSACLNIKARIDATYPGAVDSFHADDPTARHMSDIDVRLPGIDAAHRLLS